MPGAGADGVEDGEAGAVVEDVAGDLDGGFAGDAGGVLGAVGLGRAVDSEVYFEMESARMFMLVSHDIVSSRSSSDKCEKRYILVNEYRMRAAFMLSFSTLSGHHPSAPITLAALFKGLPALALRSWNRSPKVRFGVGV